MRLLFTTILILFTLGLQGQSNLNKVRSSFSEVFYKITGKSPSVSLLDNVSNAYQSLGDKDIAQDIILEKIIFNNNRADKATYKILDIELTPEDSTFLNSLPSLSENLSEIPYTTFMYAIFGSSFTQDQEVLMSFMGLMGNSAEIFPNLRMSDGRESNRYLEELNNHHIFLEWALQHNAEMNNLMNYYKASSRQHTGTDDENSLVTFKDLLHDHYSKESIYAYFLPLGIETCIIEIEMPETGIPGQEAMLSDIDGFLVTAFNAILERSPNDEEASVLKEYISTNREVSPELVYYVLIQKKYEQKKIH